MVGSSSLSSLRDNHARGTVADFLRKNLRPGAELDLVTAYFSTTFQQRFATGLQAGRAFVLPAEAEQPQPDSAFELVTWLVILSPNPDR